MNFRRVSRGADYLCPTFHAYAGSGTFLVVGGIGSRELAVAFGGKVLTPAKGAALIGDEIANVATAMKDGHRGLKNPEEDKKQQSGKYVGARWERLIQRTADALSVDNAWGRGNG